MKVVDKVKDWVKTHKKETALTIGGIAAGTVAIIAGAKLYRKDCHLYDESYKVLLEEGINGQIAKEHNIKIPDFGTIKCDDLSKDGKCGYIAWLSDCGLDKMGELGEGLKKIEEITPETTTATMVCLLDLSKVNNK